MLSSNQILEDIQNIFREKFEQPNLVLKLSDSSETVEQWDSVSNLIVINSIEEKYNIAFTIDAIFDAQTVGDLCDYVAKNIKQ